MIDLYAVRICSEEQILYRQLLPYVSESRRQAAARYVHPIDALRTVAGEALARVAICQRLGISNGTLTFGQNEYGRPLLMKPTGFDFNVSHAGDWVVCAFGDRTLGIDVEQIRSIDLSLAERFFAPGEQRAVLDKPTERARLVYFFQIWTLKESYVKTLGKGLSIPLDAFEVAAVEPRSDRTALAWLESGRPTAYFRQYFLDEDHVMSVCMLQEARVQTHVWNSEQFATFARRLLQE